MGRRVPNRPAEQNLRTHISILLGEPASKLSEACLAGLLTRGVIGLELSNEVAASAAERRRRAMGEHAAAAAAADKTQLMCLRVSVSVQRGNRMICVVKPTLSKRAQTVKAK